MKATMRPVAMMRVRSEKGLSRSELARRAGIQAGTVTWIETGRFIPYPSQLEKVARVLGVEDPDSLLEVEEDVAAACD